MIGTYRGDMLELCPTLDKEGILEVLFLPNIQNLDRFQVYLGHKQNQKTYLQNHKRKMKEKNRTDYRTYTFENDTNIRLTHHL